MHAYTHIHTLHTYLHTYLFGTRARVAQARCGHTESRRYGLSMPPHMVDQRHVFYMCVYRIPFNYKCLTGTVYGTFEPTCM